MSEYLYIVTHEAGLESGPLPTWADDGDGVIDFDPAPAKPVVRVDISEAPGAFQLLDVLTGAECKQFVERAEEKGFHEDSPVSLPHSVRHNSNLNWVVSEYIDQTIWNRSKDLVPEHINGQKAQGLNARFRFYKYGIGDFFKPHADGSWPGSRVINGQLIDNAYPDLYSQYTYLLFLSDGYEGGRTQFFVSKSDPKKPARRADDANVVSVRTPKGAALCFPHGMHPQHCLHAGEPIASGVKVIIRTDILFGRREILEGAGI